MLTSKDRELLGMTPEFKKTTRQSALSQVLRAVSDALEGPSAWRLSDEAHKKFRVVAAADRETRERAYRLAYNVYRTKGYVPQDSRGLIVSDHDARPDTLTVLVEDMDGRAVGTVSLVFDSETGLPCDEIFAPEVGALRTQGRRLLEVTRLAIDQSYAHSKALLTLLCNVPFAYGMRVGGSTDLVIEVNPRHVAYYVRLLKFEVLGPERECPRVQGAPAVLLRGDLAVYAAEMRRIHGLRAARTERSLFPHFYAGDKEWEFALYLASQHQAMTEDDAQHFGLNATMQHALAAAGN